MNIMNRFRYHIQTALGINGMFRKITTAAGIFALGLLPLSAQQHREPANAPPAGQAAASADSPAAAQPVPLRRLGSAPAAAPEAPRARRPHPPAAAANRNPRMAKQKPVRVKERRSENPVRFAFAPKNTDPQKTAPMPWDETPSASAIMSTFLTGEISPELVSWHVNQRKRAAYEKQMGKHADEEQNLAASRRQNPSAENRSEYGDMLRRMEFALGSRSRGGEDPYDGTPFENDPSGGSILVQLLTGYKNGEMKEWKETQLAQARTAPAGSPQVSPYPMNSMRPLPQQAYAFQMPAPAQSADRRVAAYTPAMPRNNTRNADLTTRGSAPAPISTAVAEEPRFINDGFPADTPGASRGPIRQVSAEWRTPAPNRIIGQDEEISRAGQIRVYTEDEDGWSPAE